MHTRTNIIVEILFFSLKNDITFFSVKILFSIWEMAKESRCIATNAYTNQEKLTLAKQKKNYIKKTSWNENKLVAQWNLMAPLIFFYFFS